MSFDNLLNLFMTLVFIIFIIIPGMVGLVFVYLGFQKKIWQNFSDIVASDNARYDKHPKKEFDDFVPE